MTIDVSEVTFSRFGAYMCFSVLPVEWGHKGLIMRTMLGRGASSTETFRLVLLHKGKEVGYTVAATPTVTRLQARNGHVDICFADTDTVRFRGAGVSLQFVSVPKNAQYAFPAPKDAWHVNCAANMAQYLFIPLHGTLEMDAVHEVRTQDRRKKARAITRPRIRATCVPAVNGSFECAVHEFTSTPGALDMGRSFGTCVRDVEREWAQWLKTMPAMPEEYIAAGELAMYVNWSSVVQPCDIIVRPTMLMSKNWMCNCWSWDHCFNAIALSYHTPDLAWDQWMALFDYQDANGVMPDSIGVHSMTWNFCKPPIHGWALQKMMKKRGLLSEQRAKTAYRVLAKWTGWWLRERDYDGDGLPEYHHGNDSGWDNATVFDGGFPVAAPDLAAYLVVQMDVLARLAKRLGRTRAAATWSRRSDDLLTCMLTRLWDGTQFVSRKAGTGEVFAKGDSLINFLAIVAGKRLPPQMRDTVAAALAPDGRFVTAYGPATESPRSPLYVPDGYWRGPIWGSETVLVADGLARAGYADYAREVARRYCDMCVECMCMAENYNAQTGAPLRDKAYTWGSSAYLILAHELLA